MGKTSFDSSALVSSWLLTFADALQTRDARAVTDCLLPNGWLRESHIFCWDNRTIHSRDKVYQHISEHLPNRSFSNFRVDHRPFFSPDHTHVTPQHEGIKSGFLFETATQWGQGYVQLLQDGDGVWRALSVYVIATDIKGQEESGRELGVYGGHTIPWPTILSARRKQVEERPHAVIIGAGHVGLVVAARFKQMNIPTLVIDAQSRLGDTWRNRYESLILHTTRVHDQFLYQPFPQNWPVHTPKDKLASWMENYAESQDLTVWTSSKPAEGLRPTYDEATKRWTIVVDRSGQRITLHPAHIVCCVGTVGPKIIPSVKNSETFKGSIIHGGDFKTPEPYRNKRVVVVGAGNTAGDICIDLSTCAESVTLVQRAKSTLMPAEILRNGEHKLWPDDGSMPAEIGDFLLEATPTNLRRSNSKISKAGGGGESGKYAAMYKGLREKGLIVDTGADGEGTSYQVLENFGGYMLDVGCAKLILSGQVGVKHGVEVAEMKKESLVFTDGSEIPADAVIFATGYRPVHENLVQMFGKETVERAGRFWGLDEEGEMKNVYRQTGHPGLWYGAGGWQVVRYGSKQLAMLVKAKDLGLTET